MEAAARREIDRAKGTMLARIADAIARDAQRFVPVDTGRLRHGVEAEPPVGDTVRVVARRPDPDRDREAVPVYVELGTRRMAAQPYLAPALFRQRVI